MNMFSLNIYIVYKIYYALYPIDNTTTDINDDDSEYDYSGPDTAGEII